MCTIVTVILTFGTQACVTFFVYLVKRMGAVGICLIELIGFYFLFFSIWSVSELFLYFTSYMGLWKV